MLKNTVESEIFAAKNEPAEMNKFLHQHESYIIKCASKIMHKYISVFDDEWSVALSAFMQAVYDYDEEKGNFYLFAQLVIKRRLMDYLRSAQKYNPEIPVDPELFNLEFDGDEKEMFFYAPELKRQLIQPNQDALKYEIEAVEQELSKYGFDFFDLTKCSPKTGQTKQICAAAVRYIIDKPEVLAEIREKRILPMIQLQKNCKLPRKTLERHRKYIIAAVEIMTRDCPHLAEYLRFIRKEP